MRKLFIVIMSAGCFIACKSKKTDTAKQNANQATLVEVIVAGNSSFSNTIEANGSVLANETVQIIPEVSGRLTYLNIPDGAPVAKGTVLARINDADLQAQLQKSKAQLDLAVKTQERLSKLIAIKGINQADYDAAVNNVSSLKADIGVTQALIDKCIIRAPFDGILGLRQVSPGAYVNSQTVLATLQQNSKVKIDFTIPELYANLVKKGGNISVLTNESNKPRKATIIATEAEISTTTRNLKVRAVLDGAPINPGTFVKVMLDAGGQKTAVFIPTNAIIPDADSKKVVLVKDGKGKFVSVETGLRTAGGVEITKGVAAGDTVIVTGVLFVRANAPVKIKSVKTFEEFKKAQGDTTVQK